MARMANIFDFFPAAHARRRPGFNDMFHAQVHPYSFGPLARAPRFPYEDEPFGEFRDVARMMPGIEESLECLFHEGVIEPGELSTILERLQGIRHCQWGFNGDGPETYLLARELERISRKLQRMYHDTGIGHFSALADYFMYMGRSFQVGPRHRRLRTIPQQRHRPWGFLPPYFGYDYDD
ncbi:hypothetical protein PtrSN002B_000301 [Pyrenophora tritici-repentis]|nr:uncharacterized protein PTRG_02772 [Pyrenophora tritici-repentis Pt-1C-BFP]KAA8623157.1 hypothetical protein PtrV1_04463 [Pyrenophora tritici-repentis]EDU45295.1 predicted protein [Pyrenophora tritici-repentis Pt-1C-BFP]KAF7452151.1 hypothetical protein A1F99_039280 [Pyrenophora tritici-repentis]KAG9386497.1 hypothetical protein A1F94_003247 [Pyrenophora tritici-repentis]KAI1553438.1 hypothetical protein PtrSN001C_000181 [Pyrenophora tritici-repentis]